MTSRKYALLSVEVIEKAVAGEQKAMDMVVRHYTGYIRYLSSYKDNLNGDIQDRITSRLMEAILRFRFDR